MKRLLSILLLAPALAFGQSFPINNGVLQSDLDVDAFKLVGQTGGFGDFELSLSLTKGFWVKTGEVANPVLTIDNGAGNVFEIDGSGNVSTVGTVDGRDVSTDGSKLDGVEAGADVTDSTNVAAAGALMDSEFSGSDAGHLIRTGAASYSTLKHNLSASVAPGVSDDSGSGYAVGSMWVDTTGGKLYFALDVSVGAAVWQEVGAGGGGGGGGGSKTVHATAQAWPLNGGEAGTSDIPGLASLGSTEKGVCLTFDASTDEVAGPIQFSTHDVDTSEAWTGTIYYHVGSGAGVVVWDVGIRVNGFEVANWSTGHSDTNPSTNPDSVEKFEFTLSTSFLYTTCGITDGDVVEVFLRRDADNGSDTLADDANVHGVSIEWVQQ